QPAQAHSPGQPERHAVQRHDRQQHCLWRSGRCSACRHRSGRRRCLCQRVHRPVAAGVRYSGGRKRRAAVRWSAAASGHCSRTA
ncbi:hypothetical protein, partial [Pseudomonas savastanoi]